MKCLIPVSDAVSESNSVKNYHIENKDTIIDKILLDKAIKEAEQIKNEDIFNDLIKDINKDRKELGYVRAITTDKIAESIPMFILWELAYIL